MEGLVGGVTAAQEDAALTALRNARRNAIEHMAAASKELGNIAADYGRLIETYRQSIIQLDRAIAGYSLPNAINQCGSQLAKDAGYAIPSRPGL